MVFSHIAVDYLGPYKVKHAKSRSSTDRWILVFSCLHTRAVNLEVATSEGTLVTRLAFTRHCAEHGGPGYINSDRGWGFIGLKSDLESHWAELKEHLIPQDEPQPEVQWYLNPSRSPRFSGHVESMVKLCRKALDKMLPLGQLLDDEEFRTLVVKAKSYINMRPMAPLSLGGWAECSF